MKQPNPYIRKNKTIKRIAALLILFVTTLIAGPVMAAADPKPVAKVNQTVLSESDLQEAMDEIMPAGRFHGGFSSKKRASYRSRAIEKMIEKELFYQEALNTGLKADKNLIETERAKTVKRLGGEKEFNFALENAGLSDKQYREKLRKKYLIEELIEHEINDRTVVSDQEVKDYYEQNKKSFMRPEARRIKHILISVKPTASSEERLQKKKKAQDMIARLKSGEDMAVLAWDNSDGPHRVKGGDMGLVHKGRLDKNLEEEVFKLKPGQISNIIETIYGYHIARVEEIKTPDQMSLEQVSDRIQAKLKKEKESKLLQDLKQRLKAKARIEVY